MGPYFGLLLTSALGFKVKSGQPYSCLAEAYMLHDIHLWCDTCWPLGGQHGSWAILSHELVSRHWWFKTGIYCATDEHFTNWAMPARPNDCKIVVKGSRLKIHERFWCFFVLWKQVPNNSFRNTAYFSCHAHCRKIEASCSMKIILCPLKRWQYYLRQKTVR